MCVRKGTHRRSFEAERGSLVTRPAKQSVAELLILSSLFFLSFFLRSLLYSIMYIVTLALIDILFESIRLNNNTEKKKKKG